MNQDLQELIDDPRFLKYHAETVKGKTFNPFDVLRYADFEIRHSNVLAWLLQPNETHGIGDAFIRDFTTAINDEARSQGIRPVLVPSSFVAENIRVERELDYVDITIFFRNERVVIAIENKTEETSPEHASQVRSYEEKLREKYRGMYDVIQSVLLTTSPTAEAAERSFIRVSWTRIHDMVKSIRERGRFEFDEGERVRAFLGHYLEIVERLAVQPETDRDYFRTLLDDHRLVLNRLLKEREEGAGNVDEGVPEDLGEYRKTVDRLVSDFRQEPKQLRSAVQRFLQRRGFRTWTNSPAAYPTYYLYFRNASTHETRKSLNVPWYPRWAIVFRHREVSLYLEFDRPKKETRPFVDRITRFMKENPIDASPERRERYPMDVLWAGCFIVYKHPLMTDYELSATPVSEVKDVTLRKMRAFLNLDFRRIETYLKCMAFDPAVPE